MYQLEFTADGKLRAQVDCNRGGTYQITNNNLMLSAIFTTKKACPSGPLDLRFLQDLANIRTFRIEGNILVLEVTGDNSAMKFFKVVRQN